MPVPETREQKAQRNRYGSKDGRGQIKNRVSIDKRPAILGEKTRIGDWEIGAVIGKQHSGALVTLVERVSRFTLIQKMDCLQVDAVAAATIGLLPPCSDKRHTITADNGKEFAGQETISAGLDVAVYFAHPYHSWERGLNKNANGLIRHYFLREPYGWGGAESRLNRRPRKGLDYHTPHEVFFGKNGREPVDPLSYTSELNVREEKISKVPRSYPSPTGSRCGYIGSIPRA